MKVAGLTLRSNRQTSKYRFHIELRIGRTLELGTIGPERRHRHYGYVGKNP